MTDEEGATTDFSGANVGREEGELEQRARRLRCRRVVSTAAAASRRGGGGGAVRPATVEDAGVKDQDIPAAERRARGRERVERRAAGMRLGLVHEPRRHGEVDAARQRAPDARPQKRCRGGARVGGGVDATAAPPLPRGGCQRTWQNIGEQPLARRGVARGVVERARVRARVELDSVGPRASPSPFALSGARRALVSQKSPRRPSIRHSRDFQQTVYATSC